MWKVAISLQTIAQHSLALEITDRVIASKYSNSSSTAVTAS
jgi:hypothetical protein